MPNLQKVPVAQRIREAFNFEVNKFPLSGPDNTRTPCYGLFRSDNGDFIGSSSVTKRYTPHTTEDVIALSDAVGTAFGADSNVQCYFDRGHYVAVSPSLKHRHNVYGTVDNVFPRYLVRGGYGAQGGAFSLSVCFMRDMCQNMSMMRRVSGVSVRIPHFSSLRDKMAELIEAVQDVEQGWQNMIDSIQGMEANRVNLANYLHRLFPRPEDATQREVTNWEVRIETIFRRVLDEHRRAGRNAIDLATDPGALEVTGWQAFNGVQGYLQHSARRRGNPTPFARIIAASNETVLDSAYDLALGA